MSELTIAALSFTLHLAGFQTAPSCSPPADQETPLPPLPFYSSRLLVEKKLNVSETVFETLRDDDPLEVRSRKELWGRAPAAASPDLGPAIACALGCSMSSPSGDTVDTVVSIRLAL